MLKNSLTIITLFLLSFTLLSIMLRGIDGLTLILSVLTLGCFVTSIVWSDKTEQKKAEDHNKALYPWLYENN